ncbi:ras guanine nucleotide exchange factor domain-containing protein, partial [Phycomyces nitens]
MTIADAKSTLNRVHSIHISATAVPTILQFPPVLIAYQLTLIDSAIFRNIPSTALLCHSAKTPHSAIVASTDFFNYLTRVIEHAILLQQEASGRAQHVNHWIKVACKCHDLKNYQTLKAIISALGTPPIQRLKRTWAFVPKKSLSRLETLTELMSEASNYGRYRERLGPIHEQTSSSSTPTTSVLTKKDWLSEPTVPFLGIFIHDMTYLIALQKSKRSTEETKPLGSIKPPMPQQYNRQTKPVVLSSPSDQRVNELMGLFEYYQKRPLYSATLSPACVKDLYKSRRRKLSHALRGGPSMKKHPVFSTADDEAGEVCTEMQQCLVTQYLLTRSWVGEKTVDELSLLREPPKTTRSNSTIDCMASNN